MVENKLKKALNVGNIVNQIVKIVEFTGAMLAAFGRPQNKGVWFVWGSSGSGKSTFLMQLAKEFARTELRVFHNELEEEISDKEFIDRVELLQMQDVKTNFLSASYDYDQMCLYLDRKSSKCDVVIINSATYFFKTFEQFLEFKKKYRNKIILISGHAQGSNPRSELEKSIMFNAKQKIFVTGYLAQCKGRTIGSNGGSYIIWQEGYEKLQGFQE